MTAAVEVTVDRAIEIAGLFGDFSPRTLERTGLNTEEARQITLEAFNSLEALWCCLHNAHEESDRELLLNVISEACARLRDAAIAAGLICESDEDGQLTPGEYFVTAANAMLVARAVLQERAAPPKGGAP